VLTKEILLKRSVVAVALTLATSQVVLAQQTAADAPIQKVTVTGSNIRRIDAETATPVQIIKRDEIQRLGVNSVKELLDTLTASTSAFSDIGGSNSFASGASGAELRNLGKQSTLILFNSRRVAPYGLADYNEVFTNLDSLPLEAVERIEVLRSGGSAIYGSDAVAGVINIITRDNYQGIEAKVNRDQSTNHEAFHTNTASITGGFGDLAKDKYNILANLEVFQRNNVTWRDIVDDINPAYGLKFSTLRNKSGLTFGNRGAPSTFSYPGNIIGQGPIAGCTTLNAGGLCVYDRFTRFEATPKADRANLLVSGKFNFSENLQGFSEILLSQTETDYRSAYQTYGSTSSNVTWANPSTGETKTFIYQYLPPTHPLNQTGDYAELRYRFFDAPTSRTAKSTQYRALAGLKGTVGLYDWEGAIGVTGNTTKERSRGSFSDSGFKKVIGDYNNPNDPLFFNRDYQIGKVNSAATLNALFPENGYSGHVRQEFADLKASGEIAKFNGRPVSLAVGADVRHETFSITPTDNLLSGDIVGNGSSSSDAARTSSAAFAEINLPVSKDLELQGAARVDKFPGFDTHVSPKIAFRYEASKQLLFRGTVESGFRAPNLTESAQSRKIGFATAQDPKRCSQAQALGDTLTARANALPDSDPAKALLLAQADIVNTNECSAGIASVVANNPDLKPETSRSATFGFVLEPVKGYHVSLDYWNIQRKNEIGLKGTDELLAAEDAQLPGVVNRAALAGDKTFIYVDPVTNKLVNDQAKYGVTVGELLSTVGKFENVGKTKTSGFDLGGGARFSTAAGKVDLGVSATYLLELKNFASTLNGGSYGDNLAGRYGHSKVVANFTASLQRGNFTNGLRLVYNSATSLQSDYFDTVYTAAGCKALRWSVTECTVASYARWDYNFAYTGIKNLTLSAVVSNILDKRPPVDLRAYNETGGGVIPQGTEDVTRRSIRLTAQYKFR
jgi:iron complex outermembrane receptor protein